jgi:hypothetical protein
MSDDVDSKELGIVKSAAAGSSALEHPSRNLALRRKGFGIGGGYEKPYRKKERSRTDSERGTYGAVAQTGHYGAGKSAERFEVGEAGYRDELDWYRAQFGEKTSDFTKNK